MCTSSDKETSAMVSDEGMQPVFDSDIPDIPDIPSLPGSDEQSGKILGVLSSWLGRGDEHRDAASLQCSLLRKL